MNANIYGKTSQLIQWQYISTIKYFDPFNTIVLDIHIISPQKEQWTVPAFWMGEQTWGVRFIAYEAGVYSISTSCSDTTNIMLHHCHSQLYVEQEKNTLPPKLQISQNKTYLQDTSEKPFFWLADTWWMALSERLSYPDDFTLLTRRRKTQGFNNILLVAGLFPDMNSFDERGKNEAGLPWEEEYTRINPSYFDEADKRIAFLIQEGFVLTILGSWGYYLQHLGEVKMKQHWRYIIARWGTYPVVWCIAGEATMPYYLSKKRTKDMHALHEGWTRMARYIQTIEPFGNLITIHPTEIGREQIQESSLLDFNLIQSGHNNYASVENTIKLIQQEKKREPKMPLIVGEVNYEGILNNTYPYIQRLTFWSAILAGAKGYSYGANGIWQINTPQKPFGASPHGDSWGDVPWKEAYLYEGSTQLGYAKKLLENYPWWLLESHQEWISPQSEQLDYQSPKVAGIPKYLCIIYFPASSYRWWNHPRYRVTNLEKGMHYEAFYWDQRRDKKYFLENIEPKTNSGWKIPALPSKEDWVLIIQSV